MINDKVMNEIGTMDMDTLHELNRLVVGMIKHKRAHEAFGLSLKFKVGDKVSFISKRVGRKVGEVVKVNRAKAIVAVIDAFAPVKGITVKWSVPFGMLTKV